MGCGYSPIYERQMCIITETNHIEIDVMLPHVRTQNLTKDQSEPLQMDDFTMGDKYAAFLHDAVYLYAIAINETLAKGGDPRSGLAMAESMKWKRFNGGLIQSFKIHMRSGISGICIQEFQKLIFLKFHRCI